MLRLRGEEHRLGMCVLLVKKVHKVELFIRMKTYGAQFGDVKWWKIRNTNLNLTYYTVPSCYTIERSRIWNTLGLYLSDVGGPYERLSKMIPERITIEDVRKTFLPYESGQSPQG